MSTINTNSNKTYKVMPRGFANEYVIVLSDNTPASRKLFASKWLRSSSFFRENGAVIRRVSRAKLLPNNAYKLVNGELYTLVDTDDWRTSYEAEFAEAEAAALTDEDVANYYSYLER